MKLHYLNLAGVIVLVGISAGQWRHNRDLNLEVNRLEQSGLEQSAKIAETEKLLQGANADLAQFKEQFGRTETELQDDQKKLIEADRNMFQLTSERDQLKTSITNWVAAVAERDARIKEQSDRTRQLADELNDSIRKFNVLATNYNSVVKDLNELRAHPPKPDAAPSSQ